MEDLYMSDYSRRQGIEDAQAAIEDYDGQIAALSEEKQKVDSAAAAATDGIAEAHGAIAGSLLTNASAEAVSGADAVLGGSVVATRHNELQAELEQINAELAELEQREGFADRVELLGDNGVLVADVADAESSLAALQEDLAWLRDNPAPESGMLAGASDWITGSKKKRNLLLPKVLGEFGVSRLDRIAEMEEAANAAVVDAESAVQAAKDELSALEQAVARHAELSARRDSFDATVFNELQTLVVSTLSGMNLADLQSRLSEEQAEDLKLHIGKAAALDSKVDLYRQLSSSLQNDINDREQRKSGIAKVLPKWRRSRKSYLSSDKSKWLREIPQAQWDKTRTRVGYYDRTYDSIDLFDDWLTFYLFMEMIDGDSYVDSYSVFSHAYDEPLAPAGFVNEAMPEYAEAAGEALTIEDLIAEANENGTLPEYLEGEAANSLVEEEAGIGSDEGADESSLDSDLS
jgi:DNA repair exonuclease SbcCD ATPase subunit